jgi:hypothetical protein
MVVILTENFLTEPLCGKIHDYIINEKRNEDLIYIQYHNIPKQCWKPTPIMTNVDNVHKTVKNAGRSWLHLGRRLKWYEGYDIVCEEDGMLVLNDVKSKVINKFWKQLRLYLPPRNEEAPPHNTEWQPHRPGGMV